MLRFKYFYYPTYLAHSLGVGWLQFLFFFLFIWCLFYKNILLKSGSTESISMKGTCLVICQNTNNKTKTYKIQPQKRKRKKNKINLP